MVDTIIDSNLVGWWDFRTASGSVAYDKSLKYNDGTISGAAWAVSRYDRGLQFDKDDNDYVTIPASGTELEITDNLTVRSRLRLDSLAMGSSARVFHGQNYQLRYNTDTNVFEGRYDLDVAGIVTVSTAAVTDLTDYHDVVTTFEPTAAKIYLDGSPSETSTFSADTIKARTETNFYIGGSGSTNSLGALVEDVKVYNDTRTAVEIQADYLNRDVVLEDMFGLLPHFYNKFDRSNWEKLLRIIQHEISDLKIALEDIQRSHLIDQSSRESLESIGLGTIGVPRAGRSDDDYRNRVKAEYIVEFSNGTVQDILDVLTTVMNIDESEFTISEDFENTRFIIRRPTATEQQLSDMSALILRAKPIGVSVVIVGIIAVWDGAIWDASIWSE